MNARGGILLAVIYHDSSPTPGRRRRKQLPRKGNNMNKRILGGLAAAVMLTGGLAFSSAGAASADVDHCPEHSNVENDKDESGSSLNSFKPAAGTVFCVKGSTGNTGILTAENGDTTLIEYMAEFGPPNNGDQVPNVSYYVVYPPRVTPQFVYKKPTCEAAGTAEPVKTTGISWVTGEDGVWTASADEGYVLAKGDFKFGPFKLDKLNGDVLCPTTVVVVVPPTPEPEVQAIAPPAPTNRPPTQPASDVVSAFSPAQAPPAEVSALPSVLPAQALPSTGIDGTGITAIIALLLTSLGGAALFAARRRDASI